MAGHVARNDLRLLESGSGDAVCRRGSSDLVRTVLVAASNRLGEVSGALAAHYLRYLQAGFHEVDPAMGKRILGGARRYRWRARRSDQAALHRQRPDVQPVHSLLLPGAVLGGRRLSSPIAGPRGLARFSILRDPKNITAAKTRGPMHQTLLRRQYRG